ncbi:hypothetical protein BRW65_26630 [Mycobacterium paraffinicum]|uniref:Uncharacterized protein n=1 Tax=Mycobacterium paraffinicum TaxID=53378 RepID=A0A1Q4HH79_9MYCO|nr:hypothetical protein BRW65_26630 [Mycobacterium paraffinicum]
MKSLRVDGQPAGTAGDVGEPARWTPETQPVTIETVMAVAVANARDARRIRIKFFPWVSVDR